MTKQIIWALFDDGVGSWQHCGFDENKFEIISIGINDHQNWKNYRRIDLRISNFDLIKELEKLPKPDIIVASPPCESWSIADNQQRLFRSVDESGNIKLFRENDILLNNILMSKNRKRDYHKQFRTSIIGFDTSLATDYIINHFKPKFWIVENPQSSKIWEFLKVFGTILKDGFKNDTYYNCYDSNFSKKPTRFFSNIVLDLRKEHIKSNILWECVSGYDRRSSIPKALLLDILEKIEEKSEKLQKISKFIKEYVDF